MKVKRIVANLATPDVDKARAFYEKMSVMSEGGSGHARAGPVNRTEGAPGC